MILLRCPKFLCCLRRLPFFLRRKKGRKERRQNQGFGILSAGGVLPAPVPFRRANGNEQISFLAFALSLHLHPLAAHAGPRCPGTAGVPSAPIAQCITFSLTPQRGPPSRPAAAPSGPLGRTPPGIRSFPPKPPPGEGSPPSRETPWETASSFQPGCTRRVHSP